MTKMSNEEFAIQPVQNNQLFVTECDGYNLFEYYLTGAIGNPEEYVELCHALRVAEPQDVFCIRINSIGGQNRTGLMIMNALEEAQCQTIGYVEHHCYSMAGPIFLACDSWGCSDYAEFMAHSASGGHYGKEHENYEAVCFSRKQIHRLLRNAYKNFLSEDEIEKVITGGDVYLDSDEVNTRLEGYAEYRAELAKEAEGDSSSGPQDLTDVVSEAVEKILVKYGVIDHTQEETIELPEGVEDKLKEDSKNTVTVDVRDDVQKDLDVQIEKAAMELEMLLAEQEKSEE